MRSVGLSTLCVVVLAFAPPGSVAAQAVGGTVGDDVFSRPVGGASILLLAEDGTVRRGPLTDSAGFYSLPAGAPGRYSLRIDADGYTSLVSPQFLIESEQSLEIELRIALQSATQLTPVTVTGENAPFTHGPLRDFHERKERGFGQFVTRQDIEERKPMRLSDALRLTPGVRKCPVGDTALEFEENEYDDS